MNAQFFHDDSVVRIPRRNAELEMFRFIAAAAIVLFHLGVCSGGLLAVDFFFILSGALMARSLIFSDRVRRERIEVTAFIIRKVKVFYPELIAAVFMALPVHLIREDITTFLHRFFYAFINEVCLLRMTALCSHPAEGVCPPAWFLSSMVVAMVVVYPVIKYVRNPVMLLVSGCLICGYLVHYAGGLIGGSAFDWYAVTYSGNIRAVGDFMLGAATCHAAEFLKNKDVSHLLAQFLTILKYAAMALLLVMLSVRYLPVEPAILLLCMIVIGCCLSGKCWEPKGKCWYQISAILGRISLPLFLAHWPLVHVQTTLRAISFVRDMHMVYPLLLLLLIVLVLIVHIVAYYLRKFCGIVCR